VKAVRKRAQAIAKGRGREHRVIVPLAFETAARISARPLDAFRNDPTQLANGLMELQRAIDADGIVVALANGMELAASDGAGLDAVRIAAQGPVAASLEACARLRQSYGDDIALLAGLSGPATLARQFGADAVASGECFVTLVKAFCDAGSDVVLIFEDDGVSLDAAATAALKTADNIARFHQTSLLAFSGAGLPAPAKIPLAAPATGGVGFITTDAVVPAEADIAALAQWVERTRGL